MARIDCPYIGGEVELTDERAQHIAENHPDLLPVHRDLVDATLALPDLVRRSSRFGKARLFSRWFAELRGGKHIVVVVVSDAPPNSRHWIITAYLARSLTGGTVEWQRR